MRLLALTLLAFAAIAPGAQAKECPGWGAHYGLVIKRSGISCHDAKRVAHRAVRRGFISKAHDCGAAHTYHLRHWTVRGPLDFGLTYRFTADGGKRSFVTDKPTDC